MEPTGLNSSDADDVRLEALLKQSATHLSDDGFSARVLAALPKSAPEPVVRPLGRIIFCIVGAAFGFAIALLGGLSWTSFAAGAVRTGVSLEPFLVLIADPSTLMVLVVATVSLAYAFRSSLSRLLLA